MVTTEQRAVVSLGDELRLLVLAEYTITLYLEREIKDMLKCKRRTVQRTPLIKIPEERTLLLEEGFLN